MCAGRASGEDSRHALRGGSGAARDQHSAPKLGAASEALAPEKTRGVAGIALGLWRSASNQLLNLEAKIMTQARHQRAGSNCARIAVFFAGGLALNWPCSP